MTILRLIDRIVVAAALGTAMVLLAAMSCVTFYQVITRFILESPSTWSEVASRSMMVWMVYLGLVAAIRQGSLISIDLIVDHVPLVARRVVLVCVASVTLAVLCVMIWYGWLMAMRTSSQTLSGLRDPITGSAISIGLVYAAIPVGAALSVVALLARLVEDLASPRGDHAPIVAD